MPALTIYVGLYNSKASVEFPKPPLMMNAEEILKLFDSYWFGHQNLKEHQSSSTSVSTISHENSDHQMKEEPSEPMLSRIQSSHSRSMSDHLSSMTCFKHHCLSPDSVLFSPKLQTILSGKDVTDTQAQVQHEVLRKKNITGNGRRKKRQSKSLSDLEFEELKGFMDLGFVFSAEDKDSTLASIIPGLQRLGKSDEEEEDCDESAIQRPYLSEAWKVQESRKKENPLMNWKIPALNNEIDMKDSLKWWAHTVASTVR
ncbi:uncharacterized protein LOC113852787 [Abrus precatorius]|uniref:Uncharacterized protein LOC113852787 n=1 Tax=Abrus precatorius TaxID=3816 RepID=A0A8B8K6R5_ABRPR|nr:uncharacterized protein LOC113852787 [Abrus precatorius]